VTGRARNVADLRVEIEELFADLWQVPRFSGQRHRFRPQCDCFRTDEPPALHVVVELPGTETDSVRVSATGRTLVISGRRERPRVPGARYLQMEIEYGEFERRLELGEDVDVSQASATYERGLLRVVLPLEPCSD
jgi:HSP20 family molecular chaperone IbpA